MKYFINFPKVSYKFGSLPSSSEFTNLSAYAAIFDELKDDLSYYQSYIIKDGERPDIVSTKLYGTPIYDWTFWLLNDNIRNQGWPLNSNDLQDYINKRVPGKCLVSSGTTTHIENGLTVHKMTEVFPVGTSVVGSSSTATGTVYMRNISLGQIFVKQDTDKDFINGETITDKISNPTQSLDTDTTSDARDAVHHYNDENGIPVDIDPTTGIIPSNYTPITFADYIIEQNDNLSRIKVLKKSIVPQIVSLYKQTING